MKKNVLFVVLVVLALFVGCAEPHTHVFDKEVPSERYLASEATEKEAAKYYKSCACGEKGNETFSYGDPVSKWDGKLLIWESDYTVDADKGFLKNKGSLVESANDSNCISNAKKFLAWFDSEFVAEGKIEIKDDVERKNFLNHRIAEVSVNSADMLANLGLLQDYFAAKCIVTASEISNETSRDVYIYNDYYYWATADCAAEISVAIDMDLNGSEHNWTPVVCPYPVDFKDHTVSNMKCVRPEVNNVALFASTGVSNLVLKNATVEGKEYVAGVTAGCRTSVDNVKVIDSTVKGKKYVGGIVGQSYSNISDSTVEDCVITGTDSSKEVGGIAGFHCQGKISGCTVTGCSVKATEEAGGIAGRVYNQSEHAIVVENNTVSKTKVGTLAGAAAENFIGASNDYVGFVCGGNYLIGSDGNTYEGKPNSKANCKVVNNTVDGVKH